MAFREQRTESWLRQSVDCTLSQLKCRRIQGHLGSAEIRAVVRVWFFFFFLIFYLFIHERHTERERERERERGRDTDRGRSRLHAGSLMWDSIPGLQDHALS